MSGPKVMPKGSGPTQRSVWMPSSPLKKTIRIRVSAVAISAKPSEIMANVVPARRVETKPMRTPKNSPVSPPRMGSKLIGK